MEALLSSNGGELEAAVAKLLTLSNEESERLATDAIAGETGGALCDKVWDTIINEKEGAHHLCKLLHEWYHKMKPNLEALVLAQLPTLLFFYLVHRQVASSVSPTIDDVQTVLLGIYNKESPRHVWDEVELKRRTSLLERSTKSIYSKGISQVPASRPSLGNIRVTGGTKNALRLEAGTTTRFPGVEGHITDAYVSPVVAVCIERFGDRCSQLPECSRRRFSRIAEQLVSVGYPTWQPNPELAIGDGHQKRVPLSDTTLQFMLNSLIGCVKTDDAAWDAIEAIQKRAEAHLSPSLLLATSCLLLKKPGHSSESASEPESRDDKGKGDDTLPHIAEDQGKGKSEEEEEEEEEKEEVENKGNEDYM